MNIIELKKQKQFIADKFASKSVMISGATGLIGSRLINLLCDINDEYNSDIKVVGLYKDENKKNNVFSSLLDRIDATFVNCDVIKEINYAKDVDYIIHCAGISGGTKMHLKDPMVVFETAYNGTKNLLDYGLAHKCKGFLFVSSYEVYGTISQDEPIPENTPCKLNTMELRNIYAECKRMCESMCVAYSSQHDIKVYSGRLTSTFGRGVKYDDPRFFAEFARCIAEERDIVLKSTGGTVRTYLDADDAATAFLYILINGENNNAYNLTNMDNAVSIKDIALRMIEISKSDINLVFDIPEDITKYGYRKEGTTIIDATKLYGLGWQPVYSFDDTLLKLLQGFKTVR